MNKYLVGAAVSLAPFSAMAQVVDGSSDLSKMLVGAAILGVGVVGGWLGTKYMAKFVSDARTDNEQNWKDVVVALTDKLYASYPAPPTEVKK